MQFEFVVFLHRLSRSRLKHQQLVARKINGERKHRRDELCHNIRHTVKIPEYINRQRIHAERYEVHKDELHKIERYEYRMNRFVFQFDIVGAEELELHLKRPISVQQKAVNHAARIRNDVAEYQRPSKHHIQQCENTVIHQKIHDAHRNKFDQMTDIGFMFLI